MKRKIGIGFLGGGANSAVGYTHFAASRLDGKFELSGGFFSRDPETNSKSGSLYGLEQQQVFTSREMLLSSLNPADNVVAVLTPTPSHYEDIKACLDKGFSVISEKSLAVSSQQGRQLGQIAQAAGRDLLVTMNYSGYPAVRELRRIIELGTLGNIRRVEIHMHQEGYTRANPVVQDWRRKDYQIPSISLDLGVHVHHLLVFLLPEIDLTVDVSGYSNLGLLPSIVDTVWTRGSSKLVPSIDLAWSKTSMGNRNGLYIEIQGEEGAAKWRQIDPETIQISSSRGEKLIIDRGSPGLKVMNQSRYNRFKPGHPAGFIEAFANLYVDMALYLNRLDANEKPSEFIADHKSATDGLMFLEEVDALALEK